MSLIDLDAIPGYREACEKEQEGRNLAVLGLTVPLCGIPVYQLMPRHIGLLNYCQNAFFKGRSPQVEDIAFFLWVVSTEYSLDRKARDKFIKKKIRKLRYADSVREIYEYLDVSFQDSPGSKGGPQIQYVAPVVWMIDLFASAYGWTDEKVMNTPIAALFQYAKTIRMRINPSAPVFNPSDKIKGEYLVNRMKQEGAN